MPITSHHDPHARQNYDYNSRSCEDGHSIMRMMACLLAFRTGVFVAFPEHHRLADRDELDWSSLAQERFVLRDATADPAAGDALVQRLIEAGYGDQIQPHGVGRDTLLPLVALGRGMVLTSEAPASIPFPGIVYRPVVGETLTFCALWSAKNDNPALRCLVSIARALMRSSQRRSSPS